MNADDYYVEHELRQRYAAQHRLKYAWCRLLVVVTKPWVKTIVRHISKRGKK